MLLCLTSRVLITERPPPGSPIALITKISMTFLNSNSCISYQPSWSYHCLKSSNTGCAPNISFLGIFKSSTKMRAFLLFSGPITPIFLLFNLGPNVLWIVMTLERALKVRPTVVYCDTGNDPFRISQFKDFPVPVPPHFKIF